MKKLVSLLLSALLALTCLPAALAETVARYNASCDAT